jgi:AcrR family transcriptional regulator
VAVVKRSYSAPRREEAAQATRLAVIAAGHSLFLEQGYGGTTIDQIAVRAGVSRPTVFSVGSKATLLKLARDIAMAGDDEAVTVTARAGFQRLLAEPDPVRTLQLFATHVGTLLGRYAALDEVVRQAAGTDDEARTLWETSEAERLRAARLIIGNLAGKAELRLPRAAAADVLWLLMAPDAYHRLVNGRGWSRQRYIAWYAETLRSQLLA